MREIQSLFEELRDMRVDPDRFTHKLKNVAFELIDADTFIAGIASCFLEHEEVNASHVAILRMPLLDGTFYLGRDGYRIDLQPYPQLLEYAQRVEALRRAGAKLLPPEPTH
jgi:hypothetical protein